MPRFTAQVWFFHAEETFCLDQMRKGSSPQFKWFSQSEQLNWVKLRPPVTWIKQLRKIVPIKLKRSEIQFNPERFLSAEKFETGRLRRKRSVDVTQSTYQPDSKWISRPGDQGVSVRKGGNIKRGEWEGGGEDQKGGGEEGGGPGGKAFFLADQVLIGGGSLGICFKIDLWLHFL